MRNRIGREMNFKEKAERSRYCPNLVRTPPAVWFTSDNWPLTLIISEELTSASFITPDDNDRPDLLKFYIGLAKVK